jgi:hypothetical protein
MDPREYRYDAAEAIMFISFSERVPLDTEQEVDAHFEESAVFWRAHVKKRVYFVVDISNLAISARLVDCYSRNVRRVLATMAITIVRHGGTPLQRATTRLAAMKLHVPSHIYESREAAIEVVRGLRAGTIQLGEHGS